VSCLAVEEEVCRDALLLTSCDDSLYYLYMIAGYSLGLKIEYGGYGYSTV
jgi:hypothetical protein